MRKLQDKGAKVLFQAADCGGSSVRVLDFDFGFGGALVADDEEFAHFEACMTAPACPSPTLLKGAELLKKFPRR